MEQSPDPLDHFSCPFLSLLHIHYTVLDLEISDLNIVFTRWAHISFIKQQNDALCPLLCTLSDGKENFIGFFGCQMLN